MCTWKAVLLCLVFTLPDITLLSSPINLTSASSQPPSTSLHPPPNPHLPHFTLLPTPIYLTSPSSQPHLPHFTLLPPPVTFLMYGPYGSFAPSQSSTFATLSKMDTDLLYSTYGDDLGVSYAHRFTMQPMSGTSCHSLLCIPIPITHWEWVLFAAVGLSGRSSHAYCTIAKCVHLGM